MNGTGRWEFLPTRLRVIGGAWALALAVGSWAAAIGGCVREHPADHWVPGVRCDAGICLAERPDRRSGTFALAPDCWLRAASAPEAGINAQRMTLTGDGNEIVFAGTHATNADATPSAARIAIARFDGEFGGGDGDCPEMEWPGDPWVAAVVNGAHVVGPGGRFWSFAGDIGGTRGVMAHDRLSGWVPYAVASPATPVPDDLNWNAPNALAVALPAGGVAIVRSVAGNDSSKTAEEIPTSLEWWTFGPDRTPAWVSQTQIASGMLGYAAVQSMRGQVRLFPVRACPSIDQNGLQDRLGDRLVVLGDRGRALALSAGDPAPVPVTERPADTNDLLPNLGSTSVLLPLRRGSTYAAGSVLYIGGGSRGDIAPERRQRLDLFDPACGTWTLAVGALPRGRNFATPVLLPDGGILLAGDTQGAREIFYINPQRDFAVTVGHDILSRTRGIGVGGLVLADGRVVLAGGKEPDGDQPRAPPDVDVWEPPYLDAGARAARPAISAVSGPIPIDAPFSIEMAKGSPAVTEVVLLAYGSSFMGNNPNQRLVELAIEREQSAPGSPMIALRGPPAGWAPAGRYLLFALGDDRIPSVGVPVDVVENGAGR